MSVTSHDKTKRLQELNLRDHLVYRYIRNASMLNFANLFLLVVGFPVYLVGKLWNFIPYYLGQRIAAQKVKNTSAGELGHAKKASLAAAPRVLAEVRLATAPTLKVGDVARIVECAPKSKLKRWEVLSNASAS